jgi:Fe-S cluster assembly iron-binding protein IscA
LELWGNNKGGSGCFTNREGFSMIKITDSAKSRLRKIWFNRIRKRGFILRLVVNHGGQIGLIASEQKTSDEVYENKGKKILLIDQELAAILDDTTLDIRGRKKGRVLYLLH